jgi:hypothetical protein
MCGLDEQTKAYFALFPTPDFPLTLPSFIASTLPGVTDCRPGTIMPRFHLL